MRHSPAISSPWQSDDQGAALPGADRRPHRKGATALRLVIASEVRFLRESLGEVRICLTAITATDHPQSHQ